MKETETGNQDADSLQRKPDDLPSLIDRPRKSPVVLAVVAFLVAAGGGIAAILWFSAAIADAAVAVNFTVVNILSLFVLLAIVAQASIYWAQRGIMKRQWEAMQDSLKISRSQVHQAYKQVDLMRESLTQNERAMIAAEESAKIAREAFYVGEAPYFGIAEMTFIWVANHDAADFRKTGGRPRLIVSFLNGGRTPAWHFSAIPKLVLGQSPEDGQSFRLRVTSEHGFDDPANTFYPSGKRQTLLIRGEDRFTPETLDAIFDRTTRLFLVIGILYRDMRDERYSRTFYRALNPETGRFVDC